MDALVEKIEPLTYRSQIKVPYTWAAGEVGSFFLTQLRDQAQIYGTRCPKCQKVYVPPRKNCGSCFSLLQEYVTVGPQGTLISFCQPAYSSPLHPIINPIYGLIRLDGADTCLLHLLGETKWESLRTGRRVRAVFEETRRGHILDIRYFKILP